MPSSGSLR